MATVYIKPPNQKRDLSLNFSHTKQNEDSDDNYNTEKNCH